MVPNVLIKLQNYQYIFAKAERAVLGVDREVFGADTPRNVLAEQDVGWACHSLCRPARGCQLAAEAAARTQGQRERTSQPNSITTKSKQCHIRSPRITQS